MSHQHTSSVPEMPQSKFKSRTILFTLTKKFTTRTTLPPPPSSTVEAQARREAALRHMGLRPAPLSQQEAEMDKHIPVVLPSPVAESEADRIKKEWETKNKLVTEDLQRERMASFKFGGASTDAQTDTNIQSSFQHIASLSSSSVDDSSLNRTSISGAENDDGFSTLPQSLSLLITTGIDPSNCPLPPSPSSSKLQTDALSLISSKAKNTVTGSGTCTPRTVPVLSSTFAHVSFSSSSQDEETPVAPAISLTPVEQQQEPVPSSPLSSWSNSASIPEPAASSNGAISGTSILTPSLSSDSCLSGRASSLELDTPRTTTLDSLFNPSLGVEENTGQGNDGLAFDASLGFILEGLYAVVEEPEPISVKGSRAVSRAESKAGSVKGRPSRPPSVFLNLDEEDKKKDENGSIPAEPSAEAKPPKVPPKRIASASAADRKKSIFNPFKRSNTTKPKVTVTSPSLTLSLAEGGGEVVEKRKRSLTLLKSVRRTVVSTFSPTSPSFAMAEGRKSFLNGNAESPPPSPSLRSRMMGGAASPPPAGAMLRSRTHSRQSSGASQGKRRRGRGRNSTFSSSSFSTSSSSAASSAAGSVNARQAVAPTMHNAASIVAHASKIEDEEMRRMTELAFLS